MYLLHTRAIVVAKKTAPHVQWETSRQTIAIDFPLYNLSYQEDNRTTPKKAFSVLSISQGLPACVWVAFSFDQYPAVV